MLHLMLATQSDNAPQGYVVSLANPVAALFLCPVEGSVGFGNQGCD